MCRFYDGFENAADIRVIDGDSRVDWSADFFQCGALKYNSFVDAYFVPDVSYLHEQIEDWTNGEGDFYDCGAQGDDYAAFTDISNDDCFQKLFRAMDIAEELRKSDEWNPDKCRELCELADMEEEWISADGETFESVVLAAAEHFEVEVC